MGTEKIEILNFFEGEILEMVLVGEVAGKIEPLVNFKKGVYDVLVKMNRTLLLLLTTTTPPSALALIQHALL